MANVFLGLVQPLANISIKMLLAIIFDHSLFCSCIQFWVWSILTMGLPTCSPLSEGACEYLLDYAPSFWAKMTENIHIVVGRTPRKIVTHCLDEVQPPSLKSQSMATLHFFLIAMLTNSGFPPSPTPTNVWCLSLGEIHVGLCAPTAPQQEFTIFHVA